MWMTKIVWQVHTESDMAPQSHRGRWFGGWISSGSYVDREVLDFMPTDVREFSSADEAAAWFTSAIEKLDE